MTDADRDAFAETLAAVYALYRAELSAAVLEIWWRALAPYPIGAVKAALGRHATNPDEGRFLPKPADVVREIVGTRADASLIAWSITIDAVRIVGTWRSVAFEDKLIHRVVTDLGGWMWLGRQLEKELPFVERRFRDLYRALASRESPVDLPVRVAGQIEITNNAMGYADAPLDVVAVSARLTDRWIKTLGPLAPERR